MTTYVEARDTIVAYLDPAWAAAYPSVPKFYENTTSVQRDKIDHLFLAVDIEFEDSFRQGIDADPVTASYGAIHLCLFAKKGEGTRTTLAMFDFLTNLLKYRKLSGVTLDCPTPGNKTDKDGWVSMALEVPFSFWQ